MRLYTLSRDNEIEVANTNRVKFYNEVKALLTNELLDSIESLVGHGQDYTPLLLQLIDLKNGNIEILDLAHDFDYDFKIVSRFK